MFRRRRYRRRAPARVTRDRMSTWCHFRADSKEQISEVLPEDGMKIVLLVPPIRGVGQRGRRVTGGVLKWSIIAADRDDKTWSLPFVVAYVPEGPASIRFGTGLASSLDVATGDVIGPGSALAEPNQYILAQGIIQSRTLGSCVVSCRNATVSPGDSLVFALINRTGKELILIGDVIFQYWTT